MAVKINSASFNGIDGICITVEIDITRGLPSFNIVGMADISVKESKERVRSAIINSGFEFPTKRITINLAPADIKKVGSLFDLPIAIGILLETHQIQINNINDYIILGELSLNGDLKKIRGALPIIIAGCSNNIFNFIVPENNSEECSVVESAHIYPFLNLSQLVTSIMSNSLHKYVCNKFELPNIQKNYNNDFSDVIGNESCKRALEIAASGNHNLLMVGPPGCGKSMMAERIASILPSMSFKESLEVTKIYSVSGNLAEKDGLILNRPFRNPHHTSSKIALVGGGINLQPGELSLAHNGVLFLDEILEFNKSVLEVLRQPLESRTIKISRASGTVTYPCNIMLVGAMNPCPCGNFGSGKNCICTEYERQNYIKRLSGPLLDRIDIFTFVRALSYKELNSTQKAESSSSIRERVESARGIQYKRFIDDGILCNAQMSVSQIKKYCKLDKKSKTIVEEIYSNYNLSTRSYSKILKVARTIADLDNSDNITEKHIIEATNYRNFIDEFLKMH